MVCLFHPFESPIRIHSSKEYYNRIIQAEKYTILVNSSFDRYLLSVYTMYSIVLGGRYTMHNFIEETMPDLIKLKPGEWIVDLICKLKWIYHYTDDSTYTLMWVWNEAMAGQLELGFNSEYTHGEKWVGEQFIMVKTLKSFKMSFIKDLSLCQCH